MNTENEKTGQTERSAGLKSIQGIRISLDELDATRKELDRLDTQLFYATLTLVGSVIVLAMSIIWIAVSTT